MTSAFTEEELMPAKTLGVYDVRQKVNLSSRIREINLELRSSHVTDEDALIRELLFLKKAKQFIDSIKRKI